MAGPYTDLAKKAEGVKDPKALVRILDKAPEDDSLDGFSQTISKAKGVQLQLAIKGLDQYLQTRAKAENMVSDNSAVIQIQKIKRSPLYRNESVANANWFAKAGQALVDMIQRFFDGLNKPKFSGPDVKMPSIFGPWLTYFAWTILAGLVGLLAYIALRHASWRKRLRRVTSALLEDDEPQRTVDEWLERADQLEREGQYREAVRCLYLACLLRFDEARVARFDRGQTNWEHLARIKSSPLLPPGLNFEPTTQAFDQIWYGMRTRGKPDVEMFRAWYLDITQTLMRKAA